MRQICADNSEGHRYYTHCVHRLETNNFHVRTISIGGLYKKLRGFKVTKKKTKGEKKGRHVASFDWTTSEAAPNHLATAQRRRLLATSAFQRWPTEFFLLATSASYR